MSTLDIHNWGGNNDAGWTNVGSSIVVTHNKKNFYQLNEPPVWDQVGHYRTAAIDYAPGQEWSIIMSVTEKDFTDVCFGVRPNTPTIDIFGCTGIYFAAYQNGPLTAFLWDINTAHTTDIIVPIEPNQDYKVKVVTLDDGYMEAFIEGTSLGVTVNQGSGGAPDVLYGMLSFNQCGKGTGHAVIDNYKVQQF